MGIASIITAVILSVAKPTQLILNQKLIGLKYNLSDRQPIS